MRILLVRLSSLGDVVLATAAVEALHRARPDARIEVLTKPAFRSVFKNHPGVARLLPWRPEDGFGSLARQVRRGRYNWVVDLHANLRTRLLRVWVQGPNWSVYRKGILRRRLAVWLRRPGLLRGEPHVVERYLRALAPLEVAGGDGLPRICLTEAERAGAGELLRQAGWDGSAPLLGLAPGARWATKAWPAGRWAELARGASVAGWTPVLVGGGGERELCRSVLESAQTPGIDLAGTIEVRETAAVLERCGALVTNDSAPLHLAGAVGTRAVALFGPTVTGFGFRPLGPDDAVVETEEPCRPCSLHGDNRCPLGHHRCLEAISAAGVLARLVAPADPGP